MEADLSRWLASRQLKGRASEAQRRSLSAYLTLLRAWNTRLNLTGSSLESNLDLALDRLILEPMQLATLLNPATETLIDIGSGSGSPAIPLLVMLPHLRLTLVESKARKSVFLREALRAAGLQAVVETTRAEALATSGRSGKFDCATIRAVRLDQPMLAAIRGVLRPGGSIYYLSSTAGPWPETPDGWTSRFHNFDLPPGFRVTQFCTPMSVPRETFRPEPPQSG